MKPLSGSSWLFGLALTFLLAFAAGSASAFTFQISDGDSSGLIDAILLANDEQLYPGTDEIILPASGHFELAAAVDSEQNGLPPVTSEIHIVGNGTTITRTSSTTLFRFFYVTEDGYLTMEDLTLTGGYAITGGALYNLGTVELHAVELLDNRATYCGGAIYNYGNGSVFLVDARLSGNISEMSSGGAIFNKSGSVEIDSSILSDNRSMSGCGGAAYAVMNATILVDKSSIIGNRARSGGAFFSFFGGLLDITNSTLSANSSESLGGALGGVHKVVINITSSTLLDNPADIGGEAVYLDTEHALGLAGSIIASSVPGGDLCFGSYYSDMRLAISADSTSITTDLSCGQTAYMSYPELRLGPLALNGGATPTHALLPGSRAIDHFDAAGLFTTSDQRGVLRPQDGDGDMLFRVDAGSFEHETAIGIDIEPRDSLNIIKLKWGQVDVLLLHGSPALDLSQLEAADMVGTTFAFGPLDAGLRIDLTGENHFTHHLTDAGLMLHFATSETGLTTSTEEACLSVFFADGRRFRGCDKVKIIP